MPILRTTPDEADGRSKHLMLAVEGSYCSRTVFAASVPGVELIARACKNAALCLPAAPGSCRFCDPARFTPEQVRKDDTIP